MGCCGLIQSEIEKHYLKGKFDNIIFKHITYLLYSLFILQNCTVDCTVPVVIENDSETVIIEETMGCPSAELT